MRSTNPSAADANSTVHVGPPKGRGPTVVSGPADVPFVDLRDPVPPRRSGLNLRAIAAIGALAILVAGAALFALGRPGSEEVPDIEAIQTELNDSGLNDVTVATVEDQAQTVQLSGEVANQAERDLAFSIAATSEHVTDVEDQLQLGELPIGSATVTANDGEVTLVGTVPAEAQRSELVTAVQSAYPDGAVVVDNLEVDPATAGLTVTVDGNLSDSVTFRSLTRNLGQVSQANGTELVLAKSADEVLNSLFAAEPILFESGTADIVESSTATLQEAAELLLLYPEARLEVGGHTDTRGSEQSNLALSADRTNAVVTALRDLGVPNELVPVGYGETQPVVVPDDTPDAQQANRRIEFRAIL